MLIRRIVAVGAVIACAFSLASAAELKPATTAAFTKYVQLTEAHIQAELSPGKPFLAIDSKPAQERQALQPRLAAGEVIIEKRQTLDNGREIQVPDGMIHHWLGTVFIPSTTLQKTLALQQDYDSHARVYSPDVQRSKLISRNGNEFKIYYRLRRKKVITVVMDTDYDVWYTPIDATREASKVYSTRIQEIANPGTSDETSKPVGDDSGFMWRLYTYWRMQEKDGGVYIQCEAVSLSRDIPTGLGWMIGKFVESVPRESLMFTLGRTREALLKH